MTAADAAYHAFMMAAFSNRAPSTSSAFTPSQSSTILAYTPPRFIC